LRTASLATFLANHEFLAGYLFTVQFPVQVCFSASQQLISSCFPRVTMNSDLWLWLQPWPR